MASFFRYINLRDPAGIPRQAKKAYLLALDIAMLPVALWIAFGMRLGFSAPGHPYGVINPVAWSGWPSIALILGVSVVVVFLARLYRVKLHSFDLDAALRVAATGTVLLAAVSVTAFFVEGRVPRSVAVFYGVTFTIMAIGYRLAILAMLGSLQQTKSRTPVAIYGAGLAGIQLATSLKRSPEVRPIVFVDDNPALHGLIVSGLTVKPPHKLEQLVRSGKVTEVLIGVPTLPQRKKQALVEQLEPLGCKVKIIPSYIDLISGRSAVSDLKPVSTGELLGREAVDLNVPEIAKAYAGRVVMVTGGGGSIGSELCRQLTLCGPLRIVIVERSELALYEIERTLRPLCDDAGIRLVSRLASVTDAAAIEATIHEERVEVVLHAAAYKHVPLIEDNVVEGARNNVLGTQIVAEAAAAAGLERFILVSTDKAVRPTNIMGATKRLAELVVADLQARHPATKFSIVRFGNVLGSSGSVVPLFRTQIASGGPVTVTHPDVVRYFMTIPEAARLVLLAGAFSSGKDLFVLNMGDPIKIVDLARRMIELSGKTVADEHNPDGEIGIEITGLRPGEKLYEELLIDDESLTDTPHEKILRATMDGLSQIQVAGLLKKTRNAVNRRDEALLRGVVSDYVDGYHVTDESNAGLPAI